MKKIIYIYLLFIFVNNVFPVTLEKTRTIGNEDDENYIFFRIGNAKFDFKKNIYITDIKGSWIKKYSFDGMYIGKYGRKGQGPNEFRSPRIIGVTKEYIYIYDFLNKRITMSDFDFLKIKFISMNFLKYFMSSPYILDKNTILGTSLDIANPKYKGNTSNYLKVLNLKNNKSINFFNYIPQKSKFDFRSNPVEYAVLRQQIKYIDRENKRIIITSNHKENPFKLFEYSYLGEKIKEFTICLPKIYKYPNHLLKTTRKKFKGNCNYADANSILKYKDKYLITFYFYQIKKGKFLDTKTFMYIIDNNGKIIKRENLGQMLSFFDISKDGYLLGKNWDDETEGITIYKLNI